jgi:hypothetical protein
VDLVHSNLLISIADSVVAPLPLNLEVGAVPPKTLFNVEWLASEERPSMEGKSEKSQLIRKYNPTLQRLRIINLMEFGILATLW